jgi:transcriptional regulator with GAF, ATPase, and Fis domain
MTLNLREFRRMHMDLPTGEFRNSIDALGYRPERHRAFTSGLLAEAEDEMLQSIVMEAAQELSTPIALVNLVLEEIQFFKAHYGLPKDLAAARGTERDVSFCQFVVRDGETFEVTNAQQDTRVPQHLVKHHDIQSYLGLPVVFDDVIVGSLCVIDTKPRKFTDAERLALRNLADRVNQRLVELGESQRATHREMLSEAAVPALTELGEILSAIQERATAGNLTTSALASFFRLVGYTVSGGYTPPEHLQRSLKAAQEALDECENN